MPLAYIDFYLWIFIQFFFFFDFIVFGFVQVIGGGTAGVNTYFHDSFIIKTDQMLCKTIWHLTYYGIMCQSAQRSKHLSPGRTQKTNNIYTKKVCEPAEKYYLTDANSQPFSANLTDVIGTI